MCTHSRKARRVKNPRLCVTCLVPYGIHHIHTHEHTLSLTLAYIHTHTLTLAHTLSPHSAAHTYIEQIRHTQRVLRCLAIQMKMLNIFPINVYASSLAIFFFVHRSVGRARIHYQKQRNLFIIVNILKGVYFYTYIVLCSTHA